MEDKNECTYVSERSLRYPERNENSSGSIGVDAVCWSLSSNGPVPEGAMIGLAGKGTVARMLNLNLSGVFSRSKPS